MSLQSPGPLAEVAVWRERAATLRALSDQLQQPVVKKILAVVTRANSSIMQTLEETVAELRKDFVESEDNSRFLSTLDRHFMVSLDIFFKNNIYYR